LIKRAPRSFARPIVALPAAHRRLACGHGQASSSSKAGAKMNLAIWLVGILLGCIPGFAAMAYERPAAIVTDMQGRATLLRGAQPGPVALLTEVGDGDVLLLSPGAKLALIHYWPGHEYALKGPGRVRVGHGSLETLAGPPPERDLRRDGVRVNPSGLVQAGVPIRDRAWPQFRLVHPVGVRLLDLQAEFHWEMPQAGTEVNFSLSTDNGAVLYEVRTREARVVLPATVRLDPGARYAWRVATSQGQGPEQSAIAGFATATVELAEEVRRLRPTERSAVSDLVAYALWLGQERLQGEADRYWRLVQQRRPGEPAVARMIESPLDGRP